MPRSSAAAFGLVLCVAALASCRGAHLGSDGGDWPPPELFWDGSNAAGNDDDDDERQRARKEAQPRRWGGRAGAPSLSWLAEKDNDRAAGSKKRRRKQAEEAAARRRAAETTLTDDNFDGAVDAWLDDPVQASEDYGDIAGWNTAQVTSMWYSTYTLHLHS